MDMVLYEKPLKIVLSGYLLFVNGNQHPKSVRTIPQMIKTLMSRPDLETLETLDMYFMYRNVLKKEGIRYDITMIPPMPVGDEAPKTHGHYHPVPAGGRLIFNSVSTASNCFRSSARSMDWAEVPRILVFNSGRRVSSCWSGMARLTAV